MSANLSPWRVTRVLPLIAGESLDGYVARVAAAHHMPRMAQITEVTGEIQLHRPHASFLRRYGSGDPRGLSRDWSCKHPAALASMVARYKNAQFFWDGRISGVSTIFLQALLTQSIVDVSASSWPMASPPAPDLHRNMGISRRALSEPKLPSPSGLATYGGHRPV